MTHFQFTIILSTKLTVRKLAKAVEKVDRFQEVIYIFVMNKTSKLFGPTAK